MKATIIILTVLLAAVAVLAAEPANPVVRLAVGHASDPAWMVLSGAALLSLASALRRCLPDTDAPEAATRYTEMP